MVEKPDYKFVTLWLSTICGKKCPSRLRVTCPKVIEASIIIGPYLMMLFSRVCTLGGAKNKPYSI